MISDITKRLQDLDYKLREIDGPQRTKAYNAVLELSDLVVKLSREIDKQAED